MNPIGGYRIVMLAAIALALSDGAAAERDRRRGDEVPFKAFKFDRQFSREAGGTREAFRSVVEPASRSTLRVRVGGPAVAYGVAVHSDGYVVTKNSELDPKKDLQVEFSGGLRLPARVLDRLEAYDLALLKVEASGLTPVDWSDEPAPTPGSFLAAPSPAGEPVAIGVASVGPRSLYQPPKGFLGVRLRKDATIIEHIFDGGAAQKAGLKKDDEVLAVDGTEVNRRVDLIEEVSRHRPGEEIAVRIRRAGEEQELKVTLIDRREFMTQMTQGHDPMELMHGRLSQQRHSFFNVFQHDLVLEPEECGGPLVNLDGKVVGLDIARAGRVDSLAIPASDMKALLANVTSGRFTLPDLSALRENLKSADLALIRAEEAREAAERALDRAKRLIDTVPAPRRDGDRASMPVMP